MSNAENLGNELAAMGVTVRHKRESKLMRVIGFIWKRFNTDFWTTINGRTIWAPNDADLTRLEDYALIIQHELVHIGQFRRWPIIGQLAFLLLPVPFFFAWFRWAMERRAYMVQLEAHGAPFGSGEYELERVVNTLWRNYGWCWPRPWMRRWFRRELTRSNRNRRS